MHKTEIDEIERLANDDPYEDDHSFVCETNEGEACNCQNYYYPFWDMQNRTKKLIAYVRRIEKVRMCGLPILDYLKNHDKDIWKGEIGFDFERALKEASDE
jgi:hypothetical protein